jgi:hypothetical protein
LKQNPIRRKHIVVFTHISPTHPSSRLRDALTVAMSMEAVASSIMRILLFRTKALARQNSCLCPTLKFSPPSVTTASKMNEESGNSPRNDY